MSSLRESLTTKTLTSSDIISTSDSFLHVYFRKKNRNAREHFLKNYVGFKIKKVYWLFSYYWLAFPFFFLRFFLSLFEKRGEYAFFWNQILLGRS